jgi:predicted RNase H-like nuclease (RuvC/YqgF family)
MKSHVKVFVLGFSLVCLVAGSGYAQQQSNASNTSLGDLARQLKAQKAKEPKPVKVFTNDNLPTSKEGVSESSAPEKSSDAAPGGSAAPAAGHDQKYFRTQMSTLQNQLDTDKRELEVMQQKLGQNQMQYYPDPNKSLQQQYSRGDINKLDANIDAKKQQIANDEKAIDALRDQLRQEGGDPSWLR